jgi:hypothetical protein
MRPVVAGLGAPERDGLDRLTGLTGNYVEVLFEGADALMRGLARVRVTDAERDRTLGEIA